MDQVGVAIDIRGLRQSGILVEARRFTRIRREARPFEVLVSHDLAFQVTPDELVVVRTGNGVCPLVRISIDSDRTRSIITRLESVPSIMVLAVPWTERGPDLAEAWVCEIGQLIEPKRDA